MKINGKIEELILSKDDWNSEELLEAIKNIPKIKKVVKPKVTLYHIGGYELLRDGTQEETFKSLKELQDHLDSYEVDYDENITDFYELAGSIEDKWAESYDDGGGSGWIEYS